MNRLIILTVNDGKLGFERSIEGTGRSTTEIFYHRRQHQLLLRSLVLPRRSHGQSAVKKATQAPIQFGVAG